jgi:hypothetical protein
VHLLCHLDSPSAASLPYLGLQEQTGPEVSGLYGSYRVPSRSSLLPLCTLSPGGVAHRPTSLTQSSTAWSQQPTGNTDKGFPKRFSSHRMISRHDFGTGSTHRLAQLFPNNQGFFHSSSTQGSGSGNALPGLPRTDTDSQLWTGCTRFLQTTQALRLSEMNQGNLADGVPVPRSEVRVQNGGRSPPRFSSTLIFACTRVDTCHPGNCMRTTACIPLHVPSLARNLG